jgi:hypothetical protein
VGKDFPPAFQQGVNRFVAVLRSSILFYEMFGHLIVTAIGSFLYFTPSESFNRYGARI